MDINKNFPGFKELFAGEKYECHMDEATLKKATDELHENPRERDAAIEQLRKWVKEQKHLTCPTDAPYLLMFLRRCKFSQLEARSMLDYNVTMSVKMVPEWMTEIDVGNPRIAAAIRSGFSMALPIRDDQGRRIVLMRPGRLNADKNAPYGVTDVFRASGAVFGILQREDMTQVNGYVFLQDYTGMTMKHMTFFGIENMKKSTKFWQDKFPARFKEMHYYNTGGVFDAMMELIRPFLSQKIKDRIRIHGSNMENVYKSIPMRCLPSDYLPDDYKGPCAGTLDEITENFYNELAKPEITKRLKYLTTDMLKVDEKKRPKDNEPQASFRKLNIE